MPAFGENLRREREMRGVSLEEMSSATKISMRFLDAIEREDFSKLPGGIFSRSFIRSYAKYLGLDEERVVAEFQLAAQPQTDFDLHRMVGGKSVSSKSLARTPLVTTLVAVVLLAGAYALYRWVPRGGESTAAAPPAPAATAPSSTPPPAAPVITGSGDTSALPGVNPATGGVTPPGASPDASNTPGAPAATGATSPTPGSPTTPANPAQPGTPAASSTPAKSPADGDLVLQVAATERAWVGIEADGKTVLQRVLNPNDVETLKAHKSFDVTTGNAQAVILTLNGETLKPLGRHGEVKSIHLTQEDLKNPAP